jgi:serine/threonine-protein kinase
LLGKYLVESLIGEGGMGAVIKAKHIGLDEPVAIKCLLPEMMSRTDIVARFLREAKAAVKLKGEHVARVLDVGRMENNVPYIVMEYLDGADLNAIIKHYGAQDPAVAVDLMLQACEAIAEAHSLGIIHRDVKASNFFVTQPPNHPPVLKVLDFGIATAPEGASDLTSTQSVIGTPAYMAPEQMRSSRTADARSDIWAMGVVLYELLEGKRPFLSEVYSELCLKVGMDPPDPMRAPGVPEGLQTVVMKCLEKPIEQRYQSVAELAFDLLPFATDPVAGRAIVEQCARLLGRRSAKGYDHKTPRPSAGDATPAPFTPPQLTPSRLTPPMGVEIDVERTEMTPVSQSMVLGRPTPMPSGTPKTPTSIGSGVGEVSGMVPAIQEPKPRRRGAVIGAVALAVVAIVGVGVFALGGSSGAQSENTPAAAPAAAPSPTATETATPPAAPIAATPPPPLLVTPDPPPPTLPPPPDPKPPSTAASTPDPTPTPAPPTVKAVHPKTTQTSVGKTTHPKQTQTTAKSTKSDPGDIYTKRQ